MSKIYVFLITVPLLAVLLFKGVMFYEYDTKQRYVKDLVDSVAYKVKITGVLTQDEYDRFRGRLNMLGDFNDSGVLKCVVLKYGYYSGGSLGAMSDYAPGMCLSKGDAFMIYVRSAEESGYSRVQNGGRLPDDADNVYYKAKALCRVEMVY